MRASLLMVFLAAVACSAAANEQAKAAHDKQGGPNIMLIIADDMMWRDCEPYGNREVKTPNLARLAAEGMRFDACFTSTAMCAPTRQQLYTGIFPVRNGAYPNHSKVYAGTRSIAHHLTSLGYRVGLIGKRHFGPPESFPFENLASGKSGASDVAAIAKFVSQSRQQPYCLIVASNEPHSPWNRGPQDAYKADELTVPPYLIDTAETRDALVKYYAEITYLDGQVGDCLRVVDRSGTADNTIVLFTSEQGSSFPFGGKWTCYDTGLKTACIVRWPEKVKAGSRTDALVQYVDILPTLIEAAGGDPATIDTGCPGAAGDSRGFDGRSFLNVLFGQSQSHREHVYGVHTTRGIINGSECYPVRSVRSQRYKFIRNLNSDEPFSNIVTRGDAIFSSWERAGGKSAARAEAYRIRPAEELYDIVNDPWELNNLAEDLTEDAALQAVKAELARELERWMSQQGDLGNATELKAHQRQGRGQQRPPKSKSSKSAAR